MSRKPRRDQRLPVIVAVVVVVALAVVLAIGVLLASIDPIQCIDRGGPSGPGPSLGPCPSGLS